MMQTLCIKYKFMAEWLICKKNTIFHLIEQRLAVRTVLAGFVSEYCVKIKQIISLIDRVEPLVQKAVNTTTNNESYKYRETLKLMRKKEEDNLSNWEIVQKVLQPSLDYYREPHTVQNSRMQGMFQDMDSNIEYYQKLERRLRDLSIAVTQAPSVENQDKKIHDRSPYEYPSKQIARENSFQGQGRFSHSPYAFKMGNSKERKSVSPNTRERDHRKLSPFYHPQPQAYEFREAGKIKNNAYRFQTKPVPRVDHQHRHWNKSPEDLDVDSLAHKTHLKYYTYRKQLHQQMEEALTKQSKSFSTKYHQNPYAQPNNQGKYSRYNASYRGPKQLYPPSTPKKTMSPRNIESTAPTKSKRRYKYLPEDEGRSPVPHYRLLPSSREPHRGWQNQFEGQKSKEEDWYKSHQLSPYLRTINKYQSTNKLHETEPTTGMPLGESGNDSELEKVLAMSLMSSKAWNASEQVNDSQTDSLNIEQINEQNVLKTAIFGVREQQQSYEIRQDKQMENPDNIMETGKFREPIGNLIQRAGLQYTQSEDQGYVAGEDQGDVAGEAVDLNDSLEEMKEKSENDCKQLMMSFGR